MPSAHAFNVIRHGAAEALMRRATTLVTLDSALNESIELPLYLTLNDAAVHAQTAGKNALALERYEAVPRCLTQSVILRLIVKCRAETLLSM